MNISGSKTRFRIFATSPPGLEDILCRELLSLGIKGRKVTGGVEFTGDLLTLYSVNLWSRTAGRILVRLGNFRLFSLGMAADRFARYPWEIYLSGHSAIRIRASAHKSRIYHAGALTQRLLKGISRRLGRDMRLVSETAGRKRPLVFVRMFRDNCQISIDSSGEHLHKRGLKKITVRAPVRENLAAAMLIASGWDARSSLLDPFCGSGTIIMEAVLLASMIPPGRQRFFVFMDWKNFDSDLWKQLLKRSDSLMTDPGGKILGMDKDMAAVEAAMANLKSAGLSGCVDMAQGDISNLHSNHMDTGFIVTNPPYGHRLGADYSLTSLYAAFGKVIRSRLPGWNVAFLCPHGASYLRRAIGISVRSICRFSNGGIKVDLLSNVRSDMVLSPNGRHLTSAGFHST